MLKGILIILAIVVIMFLYFNWYGKTMTKISNDWIDTAKKEKEEKKENKKEKNK